jgi:hypothetical protein
MREAVTVQCHVCEMCKVAGSKPNEVMKCYQFTESFWPHYTLGFTQPLIEMNVRDRNKSACGE